VPLRSQHCSICNRCVAQFDRHEFICGCIGERNRCRFFVWLVCCTGVLASLIQDLWGSHDWLLSPSLFTFVHDNGLVIFVVSVFWSLFFFFAFSLTVCVFLMATNLTLFEITKHRHQIGYLTGYGICDLPYNAGLIANAWHFVRSDGCFHGKWVPEEVLPPGERRDEEADCTTSPWSNRFYSCC
jgi:palmitoyltransferase